MEHKLKDGTILSEEEFEHMSDLAAEGQYPGKPGEWIVRPQGRPRVADEELVTIAFKVPKSQRDALDRAACAQGETRSGYMRDLLCNALV